MANHLALIIAGETKINDNVEMISYGLEAILSTTMTSLSALIICIYFHWVYEYIVFNICFIPIRAMHKSFHFKKFYQCYISSTLMITVSSFLLHETEFQIYYAFFFLPLVLLHYYLSLEKNLFIHLIIVIVFTLSLLFNNVFAYALVITLIIEIILLLRRKY